MSGLLKRSNYRLSKEMSKRYSLLMIVFSKETLLILLLKVHGVPHPGHISPV